MKKIQRDDADERPDDAPPLVAEPESFGTWLRRQREVREIDLREIADSSKVSMSYLRALEEDRFEVLPAPVFAKGFLRQYARYVGLDPEETVNFYLAARHPESEEESLQQRAVPEPPSRNYFLIILAAVVALLLLLWLLSSLSAARHSESAPAAAASVTPREPGGAGESAESIAVSAVAKPPAAGASSPVAGATSEPESGPQSGTQLRRPPLLVTLDFMSDCWVEASVDGAERISELKVQGESLLLEAEEAVEFKVGDVGAVQVEVNGTPYVIKGRRGTSVREVRIDLETAAALAAGRPGKPPAPAPAGAAAAHESH